MKRSLKNKALIITSFIISFIITLFIFENNIFIPHCVRVISNRTSKKYSVEESLILAVIRCESGFNESAVSLKGARGLMQLTDKTFSYICSLYDIDGDIFDPYTNIEAGCAYLKYLSERFSSIYEIVSAYNAGEGTVREWLNNKDYSKNGINLDIIPYKETANYVKRVMTYYYFYEGVV